MKTMRELIMIAESALVEDQPRRSRDPAVIDWLAAARARPDANSLYVHGSNSLFDHFQQPNTSNGHLTFASKLDDPRFSDRHLQAECYGQYLYLVKMHFRKRFAPWNDPRAKEIMAAALDGEYRWTWNPDGETRQYRGVWDFKRKMEYGQLDYQDCHLVVPPAVDAGYDFFQVYECSINGNSYGAAAASILEIIDRYE